MAIEQNSGFTDTLVVSTYKSFWASGQAQTFPNRLYTTIFFGHSTNWFNSCFLFLRMLLYILRKRPNLVIVASAVRLMDWAAQLKRWRIAEFKLVCINHLYRQDLEKWVDRCVVYTQSEIDGFVKRQGSSPEKFFFSHVPADGNFNLCQRESSQAYVFGGGGTRRDFPTLIKAMVGIDAQLKLITQKRLVLEYGGDLPKNCRWQPGVPLPDFLQAMKDAAVVVVTLKDYWRSHGQVMLTQAMRLGCCVIATDQPCVRDYITHNENGILIPVGDVEACREAIEKVLANPEWRAKLGASAREKAEKYFTYEYFQKQMIKLCAELRETPWQVKFSH